MTQKPGKTQRKSQFDPKNFFSVLCVHTLTLPLIPIFLSLFSNTPWSTLSNAFAKSKQITLTLFDFSNSLISCDSPIAGRDRICQNRSHVALGSFSDAFRGIGVYFIIHQLYINWCVLNFQYFFPVFKKYWKYFFLIKKKNIYFWYFIKILIF